MRCGCILVIIAIAMLVGGAEGIREARSFQKQVVMTCENFVKAPPQEGWYRITGCEMRVDHAGFSVLADTLGTNEKSSTDENSGTDEKPGKELKTSEGDSVIEDVYLPVRPPEPDTEPAKKGGVDLGPEPVKVVLKTNDEEVKKTINQLKRLENAKEKDVEKWVTENVKKLVIQKDISGMVESGANAGSSTQKEIANVHGALDSNYVILVEGKSRPWVERWA